MSGEICSDELEKEIILMQQELYLKRSLLDECRKKLNSEVSEHMQTKSAAAKHLNENNELKVQLEISFAATKKVEEENNKHRELLIKLQVQVESYEHERLQLLERCYAAENEKMNLERELTGCKEELRQHLLFQEDFKIRLSKTEALVNETIKKQEALAKEHKQLKIISEESLKYMEKLSEEREFQIRFVHEANIGHKRMEEEIIRLMAAFRKLKTANSKESRNPELFHNYTEEWKYCREEMKRKLEELGEDNKRLEEELKIVMEQNEILKKKFFST